MPVIQLSSRGPDATAAPSTPPSGVQVEVRPGTPEDAGELLAGFERLSDRSRYQRFFAPMPTLSQAHLDYLTKIDHHDHEALVAVLPVTGELVGVARFVRSRQEPESAEIAVTIADRWQGHGVGTALMRRLVERAIEEGITRFTAEILADNAAMLALIHRAGRAELDVAADGNTITATVAIDVP